MRRKGRSRVTIGVIATVAACAAVVAAGAVAIALAPDSSSAPSAAATSAAPATPSSTPFRLDAPASDIPSNGHPIGATSTEEPQNADISPVDIPAESPEREQLQSNLARFVEAYAWFGAEGLTDPAHPSCDPDDPKQTEKGSPLQNYLDALRATRLQRIENLQHPADPAVSGVIIDKAALETIESSLANPLGFTAACGLYNTKGFIQGSALLGEKKVTVQNGDPKQLFVQLPVATVFSGVSSDGRHITAEASPGFSITAWRYDDTASAWVLAYFAP